MQNENHRIPNWKQSLFSYHRLVGLEFEDEENENQFSSLIFDPNDELFMLPHDPIGLKTIAVPEEAVPLIEKKGFKLKRHMVGHAREISLELYNELRRTQGMR